MMSSERKIRVAAIGVGHLGQHHARIYSEHPRADLVAVVDSSEARGREIAAKFRTQWLPDYRLLDGKVDAVSIAVPTVGHYDLARHFLLQGVHCLVEKPITDSVETASALVVLAQANKLVLQVGHIERFNAAIERMRQILNNPGFIEVHRLGPYDPRVKDVGVVLDLMIHDIDIVLQCVQSPIASIDAVGISIFSEKEDIANARLRFQNGCIANLTVSRVTPVKKRKLRVFQSDAYISLNYAKQSMEVFRRVAARNAGPGEPAWKIVRRSEAIKREEPLKKELDHFLHCVANQVEPQVTGEHGTTALDIAIEVTKLIRENMRRNPVSRQVHEEESGDTTVEIFSPLALLDQDSHDHSDHDSGEHEFSAADLDDEEED